MDCGDCCITFHLAAYSEAAVVPVSAGCPAFSRFKTPGLCVGAVYHVLA